MIADTPTEPIPRQLTISQVCERYPGKSGSRMNRATPARWILLGCPALDGTRVRLKATRCGSRWLIDPGDLAAFFVALAATPLSPPTASPPTPTRAETDRRTAAVRAAEELARRGA